MSTRRWHPDVLGEGFRGRILDLGRDEEGPVRAVAIRCVPGPPSEPVPAELDRRVPLLLVHGWSDYVLDGDVMRRFFALGLDVWGVDLRKHGRSMLPGQTPTAVRDLDEYDAEITAMLELIGPRRKPIILAHSTGGLTAVRWAQRRPGTVRALVLNSPWLEFQGGAALRRALAPAVRGRAERAPTSRILPHGQDHYARTTHALYGGEADYSLRWKPPGGHAFPACTMHAVLEAQAKLRSGGLLTVPTLVLHSDRTRFSLLRFHPGMARADTVLSVRSIASAARRLGPMVRDVAVPGARHDVFLSEAPARTRALALVTDWLRQLPDVGPTMAAQGPEDERATAQDGAERTGRDPAQGDEVRSDGDGRWRAGDGAA
ncbi:alpha/beta hydrolase [Brachybacterium hainanense]|uniref:Alpha/beta hydrolase n=1 Tax=Brachybacterium hainanense TaxID=1541174 RepID=A0ABV6RFR1_9MICO